ncbi:phage integrase [Fusobacterium animalis ATCC 51191]|uniref:Phage integrase n=1 Tax=Fusobacterium animalis ATCC 51191 TaxID=997347 RepID=F9EK51_9FUSO|nr:phage integrase [Fusobacterium animalis ATCC 51191]
MNVTSFFLLITSSQDLSTDNLYSKILSIYLFFKKKFIETSYCTIFSIKSS